MLVCNILNILVLITIFKFSLEAALDRKNTDRISPSGQTFYYSNVTQLLMEVTKQNLQRAFGLKKSHRKFSPPDYMMEVYNILETRFKQGKKSKINTVRGLLDLDQDATPTTSLNFPHQNFRFDISDIPKTEQILSSQLKILQMPSRISSRLRLRRLRRSRAERLYKIVLLGIIPTNLDRKKQNFSSSYNTRLVQIDSHTLDLADLKDKWINFNVGGLTNNLKDANYPQARLVLYVIEQSSGRVISPNEIGLSKVGREDKKKALMVLFMNDRTSKENNVKSRRKRRVSRGKRKERRGAKRRRHKNICRRKPMFVNFSDFGWTNWIIAPRGYNAYYCSGSCAYPIAAHLTPTNHATIQSIINSMDRNIIPPACCVPKKLSSMSILYLDGNDRVVYKRKEDMVVESCGCK